MPKNLFIAEKKSVGMQFADALKLSDKNDRKGYLEAGDTIITWCRGHLVSMCYPEEYDPNLKRWRYDTIPFIPDTFKYQVISDATREFGIVSGLMKRDDVERIYVCTDSGREGEYIYRLVEQMSGVTGKERRRVWIDSQTEEEILRGIREAKDLSAYDDLSDSAYLRAKEDYLMGINFSRVLTLKFQDPIKDFLHTEKATVSVGRVMTCVLGIVVDREREIRDFVKTPFYRVIADLAIGDLAIDAEWRVTDKSKYFESPLLYKENGFKARESAEKLIEELKADPTGKATLESITNKKETKNPPLLFNLAELQNECSKIFKISPAETLKIAQELYDKKLTTYPRTDARVLSTAVAKEIDKNLSGLAKGPVLPQYAAGVLSHGSHKGLEKTKYVNDKQITDHYAIIPTGQTGAVSGLSRTSGKVYELIVRRFLSIFMRSATYRKCALVLKVGDESFYASFKVLTDPGFLDVIRLPSGKDRSAEADNEQPETAESDNNGKNAQANEDTEDRSIDADTLERISKLKKGDQLDINGYDIKEGETSPPKRYNSGALILTMENAGQFIEDEELRAQIKGSGIGTSATRADILEKLVRNKYLALNPKTQIYTPTMLGEVIYEVVKVSIKPLLSPEMTASWEKGLSGVAEGNISSDEYMQKLSDFVSRYTNYVKKADSGAGYFKQRFAYVGQFYKTKQNTAKDDQK
ncbi:MAG: type IA DNA topoisomerase [Lachnospiraceae bacterium]|nr:type IA DNA topoisomerase [Lachnospiraceae bacterium]